MLWNSLLSETTIRTVEEERRGSLPKVEKIREDMEKQQLMETKMDKGSKLYCDRLLAMCFKRQVIFKRTWIMFLIHCFIPIFFYVFVQEVRRLTRLSVGNPPPLLLELKAYDGPVASAIIERFVENSSNTVFAFVRDAYTNYKTIVQSTENELNDLGYKTNPPSTFENYILNKLKEDRTKNYRKFIVAASFEPTDFICWYTNYALHSVAISYNLMVNALMNRIPMSLDVKNWPIPLSKEDQLQLEKKSSSVKQSLTISLAFLCGFVAILPSRERLCKSKHLQFVSGVGGETFWAVHFVWCFLTFVPPFMLFIAVVAMYQDPGYSTVTELGRLFLLLLLFAFAMIPIIYIVTFWFNVTASAYITVVLFIPLCGIAQLILEFIKETKGEWKKMLYEMCLILPPFCFFDALVQMVKNYMFLEQCKDKREECPDLVTDSCCPGKCPRSGCIEYADNYFQMKEPGVGKNILFLIIPTFFYFFLLVFIEYSQIFACKTKEPREKKNEDEKGKEEIDSDVMEEKKIILSYDDDQLHKKYTLCLSGGTKRKLSTAVTLVGHPELIFLDEPTAGMDPVARKCVWGVLSAVRDSGTSIVFTSHSMDECEAICTKIVIMVNGQFKCMGSLQHLRNKFTQGFVLQIKVSSDGRARRESLVDSVSAVKSHISKIFPGATLRDEFSNLLVYLIPKGKMEYSTMFGLMEQARKEVNIEDYTLTQTDLEQVFLTFIKQQVTSDKE